MSKMHRDLKQIIHPYMFVLKEGKGIGQNPLDYSLMMLHVNCLEVLKTPKKPVCSSRCPTPLSSEVAPVVKPKISARPKVQ